MLNFGGYNQIFNNPNQNDMGLGNLQGMGLLGNIGKMGGGLMGALTGRDPYLQESVQQYSNPDYNPNLISEEDYNQQHYGNINASQIDKELMDYSGESVESNTLESKLPSWFFGGWEGSYGS